MPQSDKKLPDEISRSTVKRDMTALQKVGEALVDLPQSQLDKIELPDLLLQAVNFARSLKSRESIRRQLQYIGKLMRKLDTGPIKAALAQVQASNARVTQQFHEVEQWRDRLITEGDSALQAFMNTYPEADRQEMRQLILQAQRNRKSGKNTGAEKALFRYLKEVLPT